MASFEIRPGGGLTKGKRLLPKVPEDFSAEIGTASLYDSFIRQLWKKTLDDYERRRLGAPDQMGEGGIPYPRKEEWWDDPRSRLNLLHEFNKYFPEETLEKERILNKALEEMEKSYDELEFKPTSKRQHIFKTKRERSQPKPRKEEKPIEIWVEGA